MLHYTQSEFFFKRSFERLTIFANVGKVSRVSFYPNMSEFFYTIILLGSIQGVIICALLLLSRNRLPANVWLATIIGLLALPGFHLYLHYKGIYQISKIMLMMHDIIPMVIIMPLGPVVYFYVQSLTITQFRLNRKMWLHFLPAIIDLLPKICALIFYILSWIGYSIGSREEYVNLDNWYNKYADIPRWISITVYLWNTFRYLHYLQKTNLIVLKKTGQWLRMFTRLLAIFQLVWLIYLIPYILPAFSNRLLELVNWFPLYIPMTILVYWLGIQGYLASLKLSVPKKKEDMDWVDASWQRLIVAMEQDKLYLDPELNLEKLAEHTGLSTRQISGLLNQYRAINFNGFVNHYRVQEYKLRLTTSSLSKFTMAGLALECGFSSPATFQRIFKQSTGMSPTVFLKMAAGS